MTQKKLAIALTTAPDNPSTATTLKIARVAMEKNIAVYLYVTDDGVFNLKDEALFKLSADGARLYVCAYGCQERKLPTNDPRATYCGLVVLSNLVEGCDRFLDLN
ncbi:MAG TPA: DsrE family protein [Nitrospiria bacterium]|nr:DsrE family protein [Nitrospiria bacterium]